MQTAIQLLPIRFYFATTQPKLSLLCWPRWRGKGHPKHVCPAIEFGTLPSEGNGSAAKK